MAMDQPDWSNVTAGALQYLGHVQKGAWQPLTINPLVRALVIYPDSAVVGLQLLVSSGTGPGVINPLSIAAMPNTGPIVCYVNPDVQSTWYLLVSTVGDVGTSGVQVFTDTALPIVDIVRSGQQPAASSLPVVLPSDQAALPLSMLDGAAGTTATVRGSVAGGVVVSTRKALLPAVVNGTANASATLTIPAGGAGNYAYITRLRIVRVATAALAGSAALNISTTNLGGRTWTVGNAMAAGGTQIDLDADFTVPLRGAVSNTGCTVVMPAPGAAVSWYASADYYYDTAVT